MTARGENFPYEGEDMAEEDGAEAQEDNSIDPPNRALPDILKIVSVFLPTVGENGRLLCTDIPDRLKTTFFAGDGTLKMHKMTHKRRYQAENIRQKVTQAPHGSAGSETRYSIVDLLRRLRVDSEGKMVIKADFWYDFLRPQYKRHGAITQSNKEYLRDLCALEALLCTAWRRHFFTTTRSPHTRSTVSSRTKGRAAECSCHARTATLWLECQR